MANPNNEPGDKFAKNGITLAIIVLFIIIVGFLYYHFAPRVAQPENMVPATPAVESADQTLNAPQ